MDAAAAIGTTDFIRRHGLWTDEQHAAAELVVARVKEEDLRTVRVSAADPHGKLRGKTVLAGLFPSVLHNGVDFASAIFHFDTADGIVYNPFVADGRQQLRRQLDALHDGYGLRYLVGLEVEFYLTRLVEAPLSFDALGGPGNPPAPPQVTALSHGYAYQSEDHQDQIEPILAALADNLLGAGLPLRTMEDEWGPGQCEFTFSPLPGLQAADAMLLFRAGVKQVARRMGLHATFMCRPALPSFYASGWHLHQSLIDASGTNAFATALDSGEVLSPVGRQFVAGILEHADAASVFTTPTLNGYRRRTPFSLAPDRSTWGIDNRAAMLRVRCCPPR